MTWDKLLGASSRRIAVVLLHFWDRTTSHHYVSKRPQASLRCYKRPFASLPISPRSQLRVQYVPTIKKQFQLPLLVCKSCLTQCQVQVWWHRHNRVWVDSYLEPMNFSSKVAKTEVHCGAEENLLAGCIPVWTFAGVKPARTTSALRSRTEIMSDLAHLYHGTLVLGIVVWDNLSGNCIREATRQYHLCRCHQFVSDSILSTLKYTVLLWFTVWRAVT